MNKNSSDVAFRSCFPTLKKIMHILTLLQEFTLHINLVYTKKQVLVLLNSHPSLIIFTTKTLLKNGFTHYFVYLRDRLQIYFKDDRILF